MKAGEAILVLIVKDEKTVGAAYFDYDNGKAVYSSSATNDYEMKLLEERTGWKPADLLKETQIIITTLRLFKSSRQVALSRMLQRRVTVLRAT
jgi:hypothetical protein